MWKTLTLTWPLCVAVEEANQGANQMHSNVWLKPLHEGNDCSLWILFPKDVFLLPCVSAKIYFSTYPIINILSINCCECQCQKARSHHSLQLIHKLLWLLLPKPRLFVLHSAKVIIWVQYTVYNCNLTM